MVIECPRRIPERTRGPLPLFRSAPLATRAFLGLRWRWTPYARLAAELPPGGEVLDLGCGHGLLAMTLALEAPARRVHGMDHDADRIRLAARAARGIPNLVFSRGELRRWRPDRFYAGIALIDVLHYLPPAAQEELLSRAATALLPAGRLVLREVDAGAGGCFGFNRLFEKFQVGAGVTRTEGRATELHFRPAEEWRKLVLAFGLEAELSPCGRPPFADFLLSCRRPS